MTTKSKKSEIDKVKEAAAQQPKSWMIEAKDEPNKAESPEAKASDEPSREDLLKRVEQLEQLLNTQKPRSIEDAIAFYQEKQQKIADLAKFEFHQGELQEAAVKLKQKLDEKDLETQLFRLHLNHHREYSEGQKVFSMTNSAIIADAVDFMLMKTALKIEQLKKEVAS